MITLNERLSLILESESIARKKYLLTDKISEEVWNALLSKDYTPKKKYIEKLCEWYSNYEMDLEECDELLEICKFIESKNYDKGIDVNKYSYQEFLNLVKSKQDEYYEKQLEKERKNEQKISNIIAKASSEDVLVYEDENWIVVAPETEESCNFYGNGTKWCISARENNEFNAYINQGVSFTIAISKKLKINNENYKLAVAWKSYAVEAFNAINQPVPFKKVLSITGIPSNVFSPGYVEDYNNRAMVAAMKRHAENENNISFVYRDDGRFDVVGNFRNIENGVAVPFGEVDGNFTINCFVKHTLYNLPEHITGDFVINQPTPRNKSEEGQVLTKADFDKYGKIKVDGVFLLDGQKIN